MTTLSAISPSSIPPVVPTAGHLMTQLRIVVRSQALAAPPLMSIHVTASLVAELRISQSSIRQSAAFTSIATVTSAETRNRRLRSVTLAAANSTVEATADRVIVGREAPWPTPTIVTPATSQSIPAAPAPVSVCPGSTMMTSPLSAVHLPIAASIVARASSTGSDPVLLALPTSELTKNTLPVVKTPIFDRNAAMLFARDPLLLHHWDQNMRAAF